AGCEPGEEVAVVSVDSSADLLAAEAGDRRGDVGDEGALQRPGRVLEVDPDVVVATGDAGRAGRAVDLEVRDRDAGRRTPGRVLHQDDRRERHAQIAAAGDGGAAPVRAVPVHGV